MSKNIGFYLLDINMSPEHTKILRAINELCDMRPNDNIVLFNNQFNAIDIDQKYYTLHLNQAKFFRGTLVVFGTQASLLTNTFPCASTQILYMSSPEWADHPELPFTIWSNIYLKETIQLLTDNKETHDLLSICWKTPLPLLDNLNGTTLNDVLQTI